MSMKWNTAMSFNGSNYTAWKMRVKSRLEARDLWDIVTLRERPPRRGSTREEEFWRREKAAKAFLLETLTDDLVVSVGAKRYAFEVFEHLEQTYEPKNWGNLVALREQFISLKYTEGDEMTVHLNKLKTLAEKLGRQSKPVDDKEKVCQLLTSLPDSWSQFKSIYFTQDQPLAWSVMESSVMAEYSRRQHEQKAPVVDVHSAASERDSAAIQRVEALLVAARRSVRAPTRRPVSRSAPYPTQQPCFYCNKSGHLKQNCHLRRRHLRERGVPADDELTEHGAAAGITSTTNDFREAPSVEPLPTVLGETWGLAATTGEALATSQADQDEALWVIDSGCTDHMTGDRALFHELELVKGGKSVRVATNERVPAEGTGTVLLNVAMDNGQTARVRLGNVLYVPKLGMNLLSVVQAAKQGTRFDFHTKPGSVIVYNDFFKVTCSPSPNGLCILRSSRSTAAAFAVRPDLTLDLMHRRLGHASKSIISTMAKKQVVAGMDLKPETEHIPCDACELGTKRRASFKMSERVDMDGPNAVVHSDIAGPVEHLTIKHERYVLLFVDGYSRYCTVRLLKNRSEFFRCFLDYKAAVETKHNRAIHRFISDNGGEYLSDQFTGYCKDFGIQRETTVAYTPEQNGMAEVRFRVFFNKVRTVLIAANAPKQLWGEAIMSMVYVYNRTLAAGIGVTPYELWHGHPPDISNLREFGALAYVYVPTKMHPKARAGQKRQKLDYKSVRGIFVGYSENQKGWKILDCSRGAIISSCHVRFDETNSAATQELKRQELRQLGTPTALDFDYYTRTATSEVDLLFFNQLSAAEKPTANDIVLLEEFISDFDLGSVNVATTWPALVSYAPKSAPWLRTLIGPQALTTIPVTPVLHAARKQKQAEVLVALENVTHKEALSNVASTGVGVEPSSYKEAMSRPDAAEWRKAISAEGKALRANGTWRLMKLPTGKRALSCRWIFKVKYNSDGSLERYKARLVVIGCQQIKYVDFDDVFAPVVRLESLRVLLAIVCIENLECDQMDIETAFLNGLLLEDVYMKQPEGMIEAGNEGLVCKLLKSLYGLKQAPRAWHKALTEHLEKEGFDRLQCESCIYLRTTKEGRQIVAIYVDDLLIIAKTKKEIGAVKVSISNAFKAKDLGPVSYILGMRVTRDRTRRKLWINQQLNAEKIVEKFNMTLAHEVQTPSISGKKLTKPPPNETGDVMAEMASKPFRQAVGSLMYLMIGSRPDLAYSIQDVSRFLNAYGKPHWEAVKQIIKYVKGTVNYGLEFGGSAVTLSAFTDSDYAADEEERKSVSGYVTFVGECAVTWSSRKQRVVAQSTAEAEYIALAHCTREVLFLRQLLRELGYEQESTKIFEDNQACIAIAENPTQHSRTKHIDVRYHFIREHVRCLDIILEYVGSRDNVADTFTKALARNQFAELRSRLKVVGVCQDLKGQDNATMTQLLPAEKTKQPSTRSGAKSPDKKRKRLRTNRARQTGEKVSDRDEDDDSLSRGGETPVYECGAVNIETAEAVNGKSLLLDESNKGV